MEQAGVLERLAEAYKQRKSLTLTGDEVQDLVRQFEELQFEVELILYPTL